MDTIDSLLSLDDAALGKKLGFADKVTAFKLDLERAKKLDQDGKAKVNAHLAKMFTPDSYRVDDLGWKIDQAEKKAKTGSSPGEIAGCCCGMPGDMD